MPSLPNLDPEAVAKQLQKDLEDGDRAPFRTALAEALTSRPQPEDWQKLAEVDPEKWTRATFALAKLSGYQVSSSVDHRHLHVHQDERQLLAAVRETFGDAAAIKTALDLGFKRSELPTLLGMAEDVVDADDADFTEVGQT